MQLADVVVCKPGANSGRSSRRPRVSHCCSGPGVVTEATCIGVPVVVEFIESTLAQEVLACVHLRPALHVT
jgi:hypothetical protein